MTILGGNDQQGEVGVELPGALAVRVADANGVPVPGQLVNFVVVRGNGRMFAGSGLTNADGLVQDRWTLGTSTADSQRVEARAVEAGTGNPLVFAVFTAKALPGPAMALALVAGGGQSGDAGAALHDSVSVRVADRYGNGVPQRTVSFAAATGSVSPASVQSDSLGLAGAAWTLGSGIGDQTLTASSGSLPALTLTARAALPATATIVAIAGNGQHATAGTAAPESLTVRVSLANGTPVSGVRVGWSVVSGGGAVAPAEALTNADGVVRSRWTLGTSATDSQRVSAVIIDAGGVPHAPAMFTAIADAAAGASIAISAVTTRDTVLATIAEPLVATVVDQYGNVVAGAMVTWTSTMPGASFSPSQAVTDGAGNAPTHITLGASPGTFTATARLDDAHAASVSLSVYPGNPAIVRLSRDTIAMMKLGAGAPISASILDAHGNQTDNRTIVWTPLDPNVAGVNPAGTGWEGTIIALNVGTARIVATSGSLAPDTVLVTVVQVPATIVLAPDSVGVAPGDTLRFTATVRDSNNYLIPSPTVTWSSSDAAIASVSATGVVTANATGRAVIAAESGPASSVAPVRVQAAFAAQVAVTNGMAACAIGTDTRTYCWGRNAHGELASGASDGSTHSYPQPVTGDPGFASLTAGGLDFFCGLSSSGAAYCWGSNQVGSLGAPDPATNCTADSATAPCALAPVAVSGSHTFRAISASSSNVCGIATDGNAYCWGRNLFGELGDGTIDTTDAHFLPTPVSGSVQFEQVSAGGTFACGLDAAGAAYCWGWNRDGQLGTSSVTSCPDASLTACALAPVAVAGGHTFASITTGNVHACALTADGQAYCWGSGNYGELGTGSAVAKSSTPVAIGGGLRFAQLSATTSHTCGLTTDGVAYCWGSGEGGRTGVGSTQDTAVPTPVATAERFATIKAGGYGTCAVTAAGATYCWGYGNWGETGNGSTIRDNPYPRRVLLP